MMMHALVPIARRLVSLARWGGGLGLVLAATATPALAQCHMHAPEIDAGSLATAVTLVTGGVLLLTDRLRRK
jgi:hypothetical protein